MDNEVGKRDTSVTYFLQYSIDCQLSKVGMQFHIRYLYKNISLNATPNAVQLNRMFNMGPKNC